LYIEPVAYGKFNSFPHMRVGTFPAMGYFSIDGGKEHMELLQTIYLRCKPWIYETLDYLDHGLATAKLMAKKYAETKLLISDQSIAQDIENRLNMTRRLIETNNMYVRTAFAYFAYRENPTESTRKELAEHYSQLRQVLQTFTNTPGFDYKLFGVNQLLKNVQEALADLQAAKHRLENAPSSSEIESTITHQQKLYKDLLEKHAHKAVKFMHVEIKIDGRDIMIINGDEYKIEHLRWDHAHVEKFEFFEKLPGQAVTVIPKDIESRPMHPFILEQPDKENNYTAKVYLYDKPGADGIMKFDLYYIPQSPDELGLDIPWD